MSQQLAEARHGLGWVGFELQGVGMRAVKGYGVSDVAMASWASTWVGMGQMRTEKGGDASGEGWGGLGMPAGLRWAKCELKRGGDASGESQWLWIRKGVKRGPNW